MDCMNWIAYTIHIELENIEEQSFLSLAKLTILALSANKLSKIENETFSGLILTTKIINANRIIENKARIF